MTDVATLLRELLDRNEITDLLHRHVGWIDDKDWAVGRDILTEDVIVTAPAGTANGVDAVIELAEKAHDSYPLTQHFVSNIRIELNGDRAASSAYVLAAFTSPDNRQSSRGARYRHEFVRTAAGWRIAHLEVIPVWTQSQELADRAEITDVVDRHVRSWLDERGFEQGNGVLTEDITISVPTGTASGIDEVISTARERAYADVVGMRHHMSPLRVEVDGETATASTYGLVLIEKSGAEAGLRASVSDYHYSLVRTPSGWRIKGIDVRPQWTVPLVSS